MLTMEQALELLRDGEKRQWLIADWSWRTENGDNGGVYIGLVKREKAQDCLKGSSWSVSKGHGLTGFCTWWKYGVEQNEYSYKPAHGDSWPLVVHRDFCGVAENQYDLIEEFRHFHNLWHDRTGDDYYSIKEDGDKQKAAFRDKHGALLVDTALLRKFCAARDLCIILQVDAIEFFNESVQHYSNEISETDIVASEHKTNDAGFAGKAAFGRMLGVRIIHPLPKEQCGVWPFEDAKTFEKFIVGVKEDGTDATYTSDPEVLDNHFGKNPGHPHYLTPIYFRKDVLKKYLDKPSVFSVDDGYLHCGGLWGLRLDNDHDDHVVVFLGDLGRDLPESEQRYWRSFNVRPEGGLSESCFKRSFLGEFADPQNVELLIKPARRKMLEQWGTAFGFPLYAPFHEDDCGILADLRLPISDEWTEFDRCAISAAKIFVDYLNESGLAKAGKTTIDQMKAEDSERIVRGLDKLHACLTDLGADADLLDCAKALRLVQEVRSKSSAHRKSSALDALLEKHGLDSASPREVYRELILGPLLTFCQALTAFADSKTQRDGDQA